MTPPSYAEIALTVGAIWTAVKWWIDRRDARSELTRAKESAEKAVETLTVAVQTKDTEIEGLRDDRDYWMQRAHHAESHLPSGEPA